VPAFEDHPVPPGSRLARARSLTSSRARVHRRACTGLFKTTRTRIHVHIQS
jgi:hypothetical protein